MNKSLREMLKPNGLGIFPQDLEMLSEVRGFYGQKPWV
jgi:hypothetical protein